MGNKASRQTVEQKQQKEVVKTTVLGERFSSLEELKRKLITSINNIQIESQTKNNTALVSTDNKNNYKQLVLKTQRSIIHLIEIAKSQLNREGKSLIKADLIAIILTIRPEYIDRVQDLESTFTVEDLNLLIRSIIYDTKTYENMITQNTNLNLITDNTRQNDTKLLQ